MQRIAWMALVVLLVAGCIATAPGNSAEAVPASPDKVQVGVGFVPNVQFAPFYVGMKQGFFAAKGIELELLHGFENDYLTLVGTGNQSFMVGSGDQVILGRAQGLPVKYVMNWYSHYPVVVMAKEGAGITQPADLAGKRVGLPGPFGANYVALRAVLDAGGLSEADIQMESIGFTQAAALSEGTVDAAVDYAVNGPVVLALAGTPTTLISLDGILTMPANGLVTNEETLRSNPELVQRLVWALQEAIQWTVANPDEAFAIALEYVPEAGGENEAANRAVFDASIPFWTPLPERRPGATTAEEWAAAAEFMQRIGLAPVLVPAEELFSNEFVK